MGKPSRKEAETNAGEVSVSKNAENSSLVNVKSVDPSLALLFASSAGPVQVPAISRYKQPQPPRKRTAEVEPDESVDEEEDEAEDDEDLSSLEGDIEDGIDPSDDSEESDGGVDLERIIEASTKADKKRKRKGDDDDVEGRYMQKLAREEEEEEDERQAERRLKRQKLVKKGEAESIDEDMVDEGEDSVSDAVSDSDNESPKRTRSPPADVPVHESLVPNKDELEIQKASRTVFLANVATEAITSKSAKKELLAHMASFFKDIAAPAEGKPEHKVESMRFRSTAYAGSALPKKAAFAKKELMASTTKSTNAYVVYSSAFAAREAAKKLNGTIVLDRHLRVDGVAHPAKVDHRRCIFVGNLGFVDDESLVEQGGENQRRRSKIPSDIEEGLWRQFGKAGKVESVRVIRDEKTRVGKGFAYVQFEDGNSVEAALLFNEKKYPPMLPRVLRVTRAKSIGKTSNALAANRSRIITKTTKPREKAKIYNPKISSAVSSMEGRAGKLLGRAGAAQLKKREGSGANTMAIGNRGDAQKGRGASGGAIQGITRTPESIVFEGYRASAKNGRPKDLKMGRKSKGKPKPKNHASKRSSGWKKVGVKA
ncbi:hypothetical protein BJ878DRAFT_167042 [Calycina marina]|uniref:Nucleolar protein 12 n=1 Tax=Calycina marina TaxID=1763456 RepID=A0A9P7Z001_9HELO|nr:hypothetical protein BJ878DRAFT_167042 [Calycina marina]